VAKFECLARNIVYLATLMESRGRFRAVDFPAVDKFTLYIMAAVAQQKSSAISTRIRDAVAAKKARGAQLGTLANLNSARNCGRRWCRTPR
jgi:DNA invertase Pin-like site-specific DNA recombinase